MNKRHREILAALQPAVDFAFKRSGSQFVMRGGAVVETVEHKKREIPGLAMHARPSTEAPAELMVYGRIGGGGWSDEGIGAADVAALLREVGAGPLNVRINSGGGDAFEGIAIHSLLARHPGTVTVYVDGLAASAASFIMLAGDRVVAARNSFIMIHDGMTGTYGNSATHRRSLDLLDKVSDNIADMYSERAGEEPAHWRALMIENGEDGTWYTGQEALTAGLVDELTAVKDDEDEDAAVAGRLTGWNALLPAKARSFVAEHADTEPDTEPSQDGNDSAVTSDNDEADRDMEFAMLAALTR